MRRGCATAGLVEHVPPLTRAAQLLMGTPNSVGFSGVKAGGASVGVSAAAVAATARRACRAAAAAALGAAAISTAALLARPARGARRMLPLLLQGRTAGLQCAKIVAISSEALAWARRRADASSR